MGKRGLEASVTALISFSKTELLLGLQSDAKSIVLKRENAGHWQGLESSVLFRLQCLGDCL